MDLKSRSVPKAAAARNWMGVQAATWLESAYLLRVYQCAHPKGRNHSDWFVGAQCSKESLRVWGTHDFAEGALRGLELGGGVSAVSQRTTNIVKTASPLLVARMPAYSIVNAFASYSFAKRYKAMVMRATSSITAIGSRREATPTDAIGLQRQL